MDYNKIKKLLEKYLEGSSSLSEENQLKEFFLRNNDVHPDFKYAQSLFLHFKGELELTVETPVIKKAIRNKVKFGILISGIAASILVLVSLMLFLRQPEEEIVYAYINGKPITDKQIAIQETRQALTLVSNNLNQGTKDLNHLTKLNEVEQLITKNRQQ